MAISGLAPAVPANRKLAFINTPKKASDAGEGSEDECDPYQCLAEDHEVGEERSVGDDHVLQEARVPPRHLGMFSRGLGHRPLGKALTALTRVLSYPTSLDPLAPSGVQPSRSRARALR